MEDEAIVQLFVERNEEAIRCTKEKYGSRLRQLAREITKDEQEAEECENDVYWRAWNAIPPSEPREYLYAFLVRIVRNVALNRIRGRNARKRQASVEELTLEMENILPGQSNIEAVIDDETLRTLLNTFLASLPKEARVVFVKRYWYLDSIEEIASALRISPSKVKSMLFRSRNKLRLMLEKEGYAI